MGCATPHTLGFGKLNAVPSGEVFPDVSSYQWHPNWSAVKAWQVSHHWRPAAVFKLGEYLARKAGKIDMTTSY